MNRAAMAAVWPVFAALTVQCAAADGLNDSPLRLYADWAESATAAALPGLAREWIAASLAPDAEPDPLPPVEWTGPPAGVFVTAMKGSRVRACVGSIHPRAHTLGAELEAQCRRLLSHDPRHPPLTPGELNELRFFVTLAGAPAPVNAPDEVDIQTEGLLAERDGRAAVLLPGEARTLDWGVRYLNRQVGARPESPARYSRIPVIVLREARRPAPPRGFVDRP